MKNDIQKAVEILKSGGIVIFPTDTAFGIGCRIDNKQAIEKLFKIRKRPEGKATPVLVDGIEMTQDYLLPIPEEVKQKLIEKYWPGALTIILPCKTDKIPKLVRGGGDTLGVRMPNSEIVLSLIRGVGVPILGPSANFHGEKTPYELKDLNSRLVKLVDYVITNQSKSGEKVSTIIDCSIKPWKILRKGATKISNSILLIDTSSNEKIIIGLRINGQEYAAHQKIDHNQTQLILSAIDNILNKNKISLEDLNAIEVQKEKGSLTGIRVGMAIANIFSFLLKIPVFGKMN
ncbi:MAG: L-threonylcarbamoyladenylate synthase [Candidatus Levybacteria bacterium]|nr:L-threonylcarbamoyladenylate synthase [Candidatus Levybacteria bacterium]